VALATGLGAVRPMVAASPSLNAFSWVDAEGRPCIGITEGLLSRLEGPELQAVAAHQATHLAYDDARFLSFAGSSTALFALVLRVMSSLRLRGTARGGRSSGGGRGGGGGGAVLLAWLSVWGLAFLATHAMRGLYILFARGRTLHADTGTVAMTRDPLALAGALDKAGRAGAAGLELPPSLAPMRLVGPLGDEDGSHPDLQERLRLLVSDAGQSLRHFRERQRLAAQQARRRVAPKQAARRYWLHQGGAWAGPWTLAHLLSRGLSGDSWVSDEGAQAVQRAAAHPELGAALKREAGKHACPRCLTPLRPRKREGVSLRHCPHCDGHALTPAVLRRLVARREEGFSLGTHKAALRLRRQASGRVLAGLDQACGFPPATCPECQGQTQKRFYDHVAHVPVDVCINPRCGQLWLDGGELELIQLLHEEPALGLDKESGKPRRSKRVPPNGPKA
jgi:Zn-finger nucleic acid-binding protein